MVRPHKVAVINKNDEWFSVLIIYYRSATMNILIADGHELSNIGLSVVVKETFPICHITQCYNWLKLQHELKLYSHQVDWILLDIVMPTQEKGYQALENLAKTYQNIPICIVSASLDQNCLKQAFEAGAKGYIPKTGQVQVIKQALQQWAKDKFYYPHQIWEASSHSGVESDILTQRQQQILSLISEGLQNKTIADKLNVSENTVKRHVYNICEKLNAKNRVEAVKNFMPAWQGHSL